MPQVHYIYALVDPRTDEPRYVGKTVDLERRMRRHAKCGSGGEYPNSHRDRWVSQLQAEGLSFVVWILDVCDSETWESAERWWIAYLRKQGFRLTNLTDGGDGVKGYVVTEAHKAKLRKPKPDGFGAQVSAGLKQYLEDHPEAIEARRENGRRNAGRVFTIEARSAMGEGVARSWSDPEVRARRVAGMRTPEARAKMAEGGRMIGSRPKSAETRRRMSEAAKLRHARTRKVLGKAY